MGLNSIVLSGDTEAAVDTAAAALGITSAESQLSPEAKLEALRVLHSAGQKIVMVGDGINDAPALAAADVGCAIGSGSEAALAESDVTLLGNDLEGVPDAVGLARSTHAIILQNFAWAMGYNLSALPLAAFGLLDPIVAAFAMGLSSVLVVLNSLRLMRLNRSRVETGRIGARNSYRSLAVSIALPIVLFAGLTFASQAVSPARGITASHPPLINHHQLPSWRVGRNLLRARRPRAEPVAPDLLRIQGRTRLGGPGGDGEL